MIKNRVLFISNKPNLKKTQETIFQLEGRKEQKPRDCGKKLINYYNIKSHSKNNQIKNQ